MVSPKNKHVRILLPIALSLLLKSASADDVGTVICACQPSIYEITLDNSLDCGDRNVMGPGILTTDCLIETRLEEDENVTDFVFQTVSEIQVLELDQNQDIMAQSIYTDGPYFSGDSVLYTSILRTNPDVITEDNLPNGFQVTITGSNALNQPIVNIWGILYDNDCGIFPLLTEGQVIGWSEFTDLGDPPLQFCPLAPPTMFPTSSPSITPPPVAPTAAPTPSPTESPTASVTLSPTVKPTAAPTLSPTESPTTSVTLSPTASVTLSPTVKLTTAPDQPTSFPTSIASSFPTATAAPTTATAAPTILTAAPTIVVTTKPTPWPSGDGKHGGGAGQEGGGAGQEGGWPSGDGKHGGGAGQEGSGAGQEGGGSMRGSSSGKKKKSKKDYSYGSMMKVSKKKSTSRGSEKASKGSRGRSSKDDSTYSGRSNNLGRDLKVGNEPTNAAPSDCPEPCDPSNNDSGMMNLRMS